jgi:hypothetical protein
LRIDSTGNVGIHQSLHVDGITSLGPPGSVYAYRVDSPSPGPYPTLGFNTYGFPYLAGANGYGGVFQYQNGDGKLIYYAGSNVAVGQPHAFVPALTIDNDGNVGIGTTSPSDDGKLVVVASADNGIVATSTMANGTGVYGISNNGVGVVGVSTNGWAGRFIGAVDVGGSLSVSYIGGGTASVCRNGPTLAFCSSSLRYKTEVQPFNGGLELVDRLRPISFTWKSNGMADVGLGAEDVAAVEPRLVQYNDQGEVEGVKYEHITVVLINAIKEQQAQITDQKQRIAELAEQKFRQQEQNRKLEERLAALEALLGKISSHPAVEQE